jgi:cobalt-zinc-cadmium efflux system protein
VIKEGVLIIMEAVPQGIEFDDVRDALISIDEVLDVHDLHIWSLSSQEVALSCHVCMRENDMLRGPQIIARVNEVLHSRFGIGHATIQLETEECTRNEILCRHRKEI